MAKAGTRRRQKKKGAPGGEATREGARPPVSRSRFDVERAERVFEKLTQGREFINEHAMDVFLSGLLEQEDLHALMDRFREDAGEQAQELAYEAMEEEDEGRALELARKALKLDPGCIDARMAEVEISVVNANERIDAYRHIVDDAREAQGREFLRKNRGMLAQYVSARPLLRSLDTLARELAAGGSEDEAVTVCEELLRLDSADMMDIRETLLGLYLGRDNLLPAGMLLDKFPEDISAVFRWGRTIERFLAGDMDEARRTLDEAVRSNNHVLLIKLGAVERPRSIRRDYAPGSVGEAWYCILTLLTVFRKHPEFFDWAFAEVMAPVI